MVIINCVFSNELGYGWFKWSSSHFNKIYVVSLGKLFLVLALVAKLLVSGVSDFDEGSPGDVGSATSGRRSLLVRPLCKDKDPETSLWLPLPDAGAATYGVYEALP